MADKDVTTKVILQGDQASMVNAFKISTAEATKMRDSIVGALGGIGTAAAGVMAVLGGGALFKDAIDTTKEVTGEILKLKNSMGISAEDASILRVALDDVFVSTDDFAAAAARVTKQLVTNEGAFTRLGVSTRDSNGNLRATADIMADTNAKLLEFREGTDRNIEGVKIYGKGWEEARKTLKLTAEAMDDGRKRAEELHLIIGDSGLKAVKAYKSAMKDIGDVSESLKVNLGMALIPELTKLAVAFGDGAVKGIPMFITGLHNVEAEITRMAMLVDKTGGTLTTMMYYLAGGKFTDAGKWWKEQNQVYEQRYKENEKILIKMAMAEVGLDENGNPLAKDKAKGKGGDKRSTGGVAASDWTAAHNKYIEYQKAFEERRAAQIKIGNDFELEMNRQAYALGLTDLDTYLNRKNELTLSSLNAEVIARQNELVAAQKALKELKPVTDRKGIGNPSKDAENYHAALTKEEQAQKALAEAVGKLTLEKEKLKDSDREAIYQAARGYQELQAALADFQGDLVKAAEIRKKLDEESHARKQLEIQATMGDMEAEKALAAQRIMDAEKVRQASVDRANITKNLKFENISIGINTPTIFGDTDASAALKLQHDKEMSVLNDQLEKKKALNQQETEDYRLMLEKKQALTVQYNAVQSKMTMDSWKDIGGIVSGRIGQIAGMMNQQNEDQFLAWKALASAQAVISTALAVAGILGAESKLGVAAIPLAITAGAIGAAQIGIIAGTQFKGAREKGGPVSGGSTYLVGEKGPELFTPGATGMITPNHVLSSGQGVTINNSYDFRGADASTEQRLRAEINANGERVKAEILNNMNRGGRFAIASGRMR